ncbi:alkaline phosphatase D family protein [Pelagibaculum spongiae]|uniref:Alkaline phosphatase n=1 Tax=Pelagibaculum spongiae TaxID=2080658 RepID=A0A2V1GVP3_9GAMM|nr:alkaline phosphatase D family protein [Pelagibaculum spongiae]PVZ69761.1 hypothetical protein DC094_10715 [Pelagibaculum spongiae]
MAISRRRFFIGAASSAALPLIGGLAKAADPDAQFAHGVASGDPLQDRVILWSRVTQQDMSQMIDVRWTIASDPEMVNIVQSGWHLTGPDRDHTIKVDVTGLQPATTYYYQFDLPQGTTSMVGRTRTLPTGSPEHLRIAMCSCSNLPYGYFNAYKQMAKRADLDLVLHLGDYIYEYGDGQYGDIRSPLPAHEMLTLQDYRTRHGQYKTDVDLQAVHQQHPFINVWDDHEFTNDTWNGGAENHTEGEEGAWVERKQNAIRAFYEWLPIRQTDAEDKSRIFRQFALGDLADLTMLDTRFYGRSEQAPGIVSEIAKLVKDGLFNEEDMQRLTAKIDMETVEDESRSLLGAEQEDWLYQQLSSSNNNNTIWKLLGQQVMMGQLGFNNIGFNMDQWDGYKPSRQRFLDHITGKQSGEKIDNVVVLTGDIHSSWAMEVAENPYSSQQYDYVSGEGSVAVEFVTPGISSPGIPEEKLAVLAADAIKIVNPHIKYCNFFYRGYVVLDIKRDRIQADWFHVPTVDEPSDEEFHAKAYEVTNGRNRIEVVKSGPAENKANPPALVTAPFYLNQPAS